MHVQQIRIYAQKEVQQVRKAVLHYKTVVEKHNTLKHSGTALTSEHFIPITTSINDLDAAYEALQNKINKKQGKGNANDILFRQVIEAVCKELNTSSKQIDKSTQEILEDSESVKKKLVMEMIRSNARLRFSSTLFSNCLQILKEKFRFK